MMDCTMLAGSFQDDMQAIAAVCTVLFGVFVAGIWKAALCLSRIARRLDELAEQKGEKKESSPSVQV
ncbi:MAG: hypothetical protein ACYS5V_05960 [Planctomycetota bacterium]